jgi:hypothetical protein
MSPWDVVYLEMLFLALTALVATLALRSAWRQRFEPPLTPVRVVLPPLFVVAGFLLMVLTRTDSPNRLLLIAAAVFLASVGWLVSRGL